MVNTEEGNGFPVTEVTGISYHVDVGAFLEEQPVFLTCLFILFYV